MNTILLTCKNDDCERTFRVPEYVRPNSTIKSKLNQECKICKNKALLGKSTLYDKNTREKKQVKSRSYSTMNKEVRDGKKSSPKKTAKKPRKQNINKALDNAWSKLVKLDGGMKCAVCGKEKALNSHHIYSRAKKSVCWDTDNGIVLCVGHHIGNKFSAHKTPVPFTAWIIKKLGSKFMDNLEVKANSTSHFHEFEKQIMLDELNKRINQY